MASAAASMASAAEAPTRQEPDSPRTIVRDAAVRHGVKPDVALAIVSCETGGTFDPGIQSLVTKYGVREDSWGLAQIHLPDHPTITRDQATDPYFAAEFLATNLSTGNAHIWSCWRLLGRPSPV